LGSLEGEGDAFACFGCPLLESPGCQGQLLGEAAGDEGAARIQTQLGHARAVTSVAFSPDGKFALSGSDDKTLKLWEPAMGRELRAFAGDKKKILGGLTRWMT
jgi:WD40 repeat protein